MKKLITIFVLLVLFPLNVYAVYVNGYYRSNGTYVNGYERTAPDSSPYNNYGYPGNYNPNTGSITSGSQSTYLNNYYNNSSGYSAPSYSGYSYAYPTTPTCPLNSYYDGVSSCKCNYGYSVSGGSCVSQDSLCWAQLGYSSSYDSLNNTCKCNYGEVIGSSGKCTSASSVCTEQIGLMSQYNSTSKKCECMYGYEYNGSSCVYKATNYSVTYPPSSNSYTACPGNSHISTTDQTQCLCDSGFQINSSKTACVATSLCSDGYVATTNGLCITYNQSCQSVNNADAKIVGSIGADGKIGCNCVAGYSWNGNKCSEDIVTASIPESTPEIQKQDIAPQIKNKVPKKQVSVEDVATSTTNNKHSSTATTTSTSVKKVASDRQTQKHWYGWLNPFSWLK